MFKAKIIESKNYYKFRTKQLLLMFLMSLLIGLVVNFYQIPIWLTILLCGFYILGIVLMARNQKRITSIFGNKLIEIDEREIRIKSKKGNRVEIINLDEVEKLILKKEYSMPQETIKEIGEEIAGNAKQNFIIITQNSKDRRLDFEIDSYFMIKQLNKIIENWISRGYNIERK